MISDQTDSAQGNTRATTEAVENTAAGLDFIQDDGRVEELTAAELNARLAAAPDEAARLAVALAPDVLRAAAGLQRTGDAYAAAELRRTVRSHKVPAKAWDEGVTHAFATLRANAEAEDLARQREASARARAARIEAEAATETAAREALDAKRRELGEDLAPYADTLEAGDGTVYEMEPGRMTATVPTTRPDGTAGRPKLRHLMDASARIVARVAERQQPDGDATTWLRVGFARRVGAPFTVEIPAAQFDACNWITEATGLEVSVSTGRDTRDLIRHAVSLTAKGTPHVERAAYLGWVHRDGRWMRLHAGGAIDAAGAVAGVDVRAPGKLARYALPAPPEGDARADALDALRELVTLEPAEAVLPVVAFVLRAMIGPGAGVCHLHGRATLGKSHLGALALCLSGDFDGPRSLPGEWEKDTTNFTAKALSVAGDVAWGLDDWRPAWDPSGTKFHDVARAVFNMAGRGALSRTRGFNDTPDPRGSVLSTGEALPTGGSWSGLSRVLAVEITERVALPGGIYAPQPDDEEPERAFTVRGPQQLARAGAALIQWLAPRMDTWRDPEAVSSRKRLVAAERTALARWGVRESARAVDVLGPVALGAEVLCTFLRKSGAMTPRDLAALDARVRRALGALASDRNDTLADLAPGKAWLDTLAGLLRSGTCHAAVVRANKLTSGEPTDVSALGHFGWRRKDGHWLPQGPTVAHLDGRYPNALAIDPGVAVGVVAADLRRRGLAAEINTTDHLSRELAAAGLIAERESAKRATVRTRVDGSAAPRLVVKLSALGFTPMDPDTEEPSPSDEE